MSKQKNNIAFYEGNSWYHRIKILNQDGTTTYSKRGGFKSIKEAEESYYKYKDEYENAVRRKEAIKKDNISFKDYLIYWYEDVYSEQVENTTKMIAAYTLYRLILPNLNEENIKLSLVTTSYLDELLVNISGMTKSAGNKAREFFILAFKYAVTYGFIKDNPVSNTKKYKREKPHIIILSKNKIKTLLLEASQTSWYLEILLALFCGLRKGEILGLKRLDINYESNTLTVTRQITANPTIQKGSSKVVDYEVLEKEPKTVNSYRTLKVPDEVMNEIRKRNQRNDEIKQKYGDGFIDNGYLSCQENGLPHAVTSINSALTKICNKAGLPHITVHGLRHMYATILMEQGVPIVKISALLGHSSINTTFEYYCEIIDETDKVISFLNDSFEME